MGSPLSLKLSPVKRIQIVDENIVVAFNERIVRSILRVHGPESLVNVHIIVEILVIKT